MRRVDRLALVICGMLLVACGAEQPDGTSQPGDAGSTPAPAPAESASPTPPAPTSTPTPSAGATAQQRRLRGVDVSHHQGRVDWPRVRRDGIGFAYLKATEASTFTDPRFVANARAARAAGLRVGGYHYFSLCSPGAPQGEHFSEVLASGPAGSMPPAVDLELIGNCADPPGRDALLREVRAFLDVVEPRTGQRVVVYAHPDLEARFAVRDALDRRLWVRRIGTTPPAGDWWIWQRDDRASIDGITGPADLNVARP